MSLTLVGRHAERAAVGRLLAEARNGCGGCLVLVGEDGMGKSALLEYTARRAAGMTVSAISGAEAEASFPFAALRRLLTSALHRAEKSHRESASLTRALGLDGDRSPLSVGLALVELLEAVTFDRPLLCAVDDAHWLDTCSADAIAFAARRASTARLAVLIAAREDVNGPWLLGGLGELRIGRLTERDARRLLAVQRGSVLDDRVATRLVSEARGNPGVLLELRSGLTPAEASGALPLPKTLRIDGPLARRLTARVRAFAPSTQTLLLLAAAQCDGDGDVLRRAAEQLGLGLERLAPAEAANLVTTNPRVEFRHPLVRVAVYGAALPAHRRAVHRALADATDAELDPVQHAWHRAAATPRQDEAVAAELVRAVMASGVYGGHGQAAFLLEQAAALTPDKSRRAERMLAAVECELAVGRPGEASSMLARARPYVVADLHLARAKQLSGLIDIALAYSGDTPEALLEAAQAFERVDGVLARDTYLIALMAALGAGSLGDGARIARAAKAARQAAKLPLSSKTLNDLLLDGFASLVLEGHRAAQPALRSAVDRLHTGVDTASLAWGCRAAIELWDDEALFTLSTRNIEVAKACRGLTALGVAFAFRGGLYEVIVGRLDEAANDLRRAYEVSGPIRNDAVAARVALGRLLVLAWRGDEKRARDVIATAICDAAARGRGGEIAFAQYALSVLDNGLGQYRNAAAAAMEATATETLFAATLMLPELVEAATRSHQPELAAAALDRIAVSATASGTDWALGILARSRALLAEGDAADALYRNAIGHLKRCRVMPQLARTQLLYGEWLRRARRPREAREQLRSAHLLLTSMGLTAFAQRAWIELAATGERPRRQTAEVMRHLTPQEARIALLAAEGLSNPQIASQLVMSPRTVEYHLRKVFRKLEISSRVHLARELHGRTVLAAADFLAPSLSNGRVVPSRTGQAEHRIAARGAAVRPPS